MGMIQKHNSPGNSHEQQTLSTQGYLIQLQEIYEAKTRQNEQMVIWTSTEQEGKRKKKTPNKKPTKKILGKTQLKPQMTTITPKKQITTRMRKNEKGQIITVLKPAEMA